MPEGGKGDNTPQQGTVESQKDKKYVKKEMKKDVMGSSQLQCKLTRLSGLWIVLKGRKTQMN